MLAQMGFSEYKVFRNIIADVASIDDMVKCAGVFDTQGKGHR